MKYSSVLFLRLAVAVGLAAFPAIFSAVFTPLTIYPTFFLFSLFRDATLTGTLMTTAGATIDFIPACIAASAYLLLALLILLTKDISFRTGILLFLLGSALILTANIIRIEILIFILLTKGVNAFAQLHLVFWKVIASIYVFLVWIFLTWLFHIKTIPFSSDFHTLRTRKA